MKEQAGELKSETLLLRFERSQLRWFRHLTQMPTGHLLGKVLTACLMGRKPQSRHRIRWRDCISHLAWEHLWESQEELEDVA